MSYIVDSHLQRFPYQPSPRGATCPLAPPETVPGCLHVFPGTSFSNSDFGVSVVHVDIHKTLTCFMSPEKAQLQEGGPQCSKERLQDHEWHPPPSLSLLILASLSCRVFLKIYMGWYDLSASQNCLDSSLCSLLKQCRGNISHYVIITFHCFISN